jgi:ABC-type multidrug transport system ATPase subunit
VWAELTVKDHLVLYARLKGVPSAQQQAAATLAATKVGLDGDAFGLKSKELSGGMRRRLSIAAALVGDPKVKKNWNIKNATANIKRRCVLNRCLAMVFS